MRVAIYCRVSTSDQNCDRQEEELTAYCHRADFQVVGIWKETASGAKVDRQMRRFVMELAQRREIDAILVHELSRWGRSTVDLISSLQELASWGISLVALNGMQLDLNTPQGKLMTTILSSIAEFERDLLRERVKSGMAAAIAAGKHVGRPPGRSPKIRRLTPKIRKLRGEGLSLRSIAYQLRISKATVQQVLKK